MSSNSVKKNLSKEVHEEVKRLFDSRDDHEDAVVQYKIQQIRSLSKVRDNAALEVENLTAQLNQARATVLRTEPKLELAMDDLKHFLITYLEATDAKATE